MIGGRVNMTIETQSARRARGLEQLSVVLTAVVTDLEFRRDVERLHRLGSRVLYELLTEIGEQRVCRTFIEQRVQRYSEIDPDHLAALDGDTFPRPPLYEVAPCT